MENQPITTRPSQFKRRFLWGLVTGGMIIVLGVLISVFLPLKQAKTEEIAAEIVEEFFVGVAALDVEENQRAAEIFKQLSVRIPDEPAVWANRGIALLRLNEIDTARQAFLRANELTRQNSEIQVLLAIADERDGQFETAIKRLRSLNDADARALYLLADLIERVGDETATEDQLEIIQRLRKRHPDNLVAQFDEARLAAKLQNSNQLELSIKLLGDHRSGWNDLARDQYEAAAQAAAAGKFLDAARFLTFLENVNKPTPLYQQGLREIGKTTDSLGRPIELFLAYQQPTILVADADQDLKFQVQNISEKAVRPHMVWTVLLSGEHHSTLSLTGDQLTVEPLAALPFPHKNIETPVSQQSVVCVDLNADFRRDLVLAGDAGLAIFLQADNEQFTAFSPNDEVIAEFERPLNGVWAFDLEADGDLDLLLSNASSGNVDNEPSGCTVLRNNGDLSFSTVESLRGLPALQDMNWIDFDDDGDIDIAGRTQQGDVFIAWNERSGRYSVPAKLDVFDPLVASAVGDLDADGVVELIGLDHTGGLSSFAYSRATKSWESKQIATWSMEPQSFSGTNNHRSSLFLADVDNNGAIDIVSSASSTSAIWLTGRDGILRQLRNTPEMFISSVTDVDDDGRLDLVGLSQSGEVVAHNRGTKDYGWHIVRPRANPHPGDKRINSFGIGGLVEMHAGRLVQVAPIQSPRVHFGLGEHQRAGVARIVWPNGTLQAEFDLKAGEATVADQRLKGSCPWVFAVNDEGVNFVKDFIWRSPLGLKINSQETAGVMQTEDWIMIPGDLLTSRDGTYEVRITADLWETHFFDHVSLVVVDHPATVDVHVDERFVPTQSPELRVLACAPLKELQNPRDEFGQIMTEKLSEIDQEYVDTFPVGEYQGVAEEHWVEFELPEHLPINQQVCLIGHGWIYPTDSSLNVAMSQGKSQPLHGLILEIPKAAKGDPKGDKREWQSVSDDLGFPAGKNKTIVIPLPTKLLQAGQRHFRLRTNLEVYWDQLGWSVIRDEVDLKSTPVETLIAELRHRGFSQLSPIDRRRPDLPIYESIASMGSRWRDLEGFYTRFGDVRELLREVDDRYVIMNAGDEMVFRFSVAGELLPGWKRDFVLIGDGWVKDGDLNTNHSRTVVPLPTHENAVYEGALRTLFDDPVFRIHRKDWETYHTRYVEPRSPFRATGNHAMQK